MKTLNQLQDELKIQYDKYIDKKEEEDKKKDLIQKRKYLSNEILKYKHPTLYKTKEHLGSNIKKVNEHIKKNIKTIRPRLQQHDNKDPLGLSNIYPSYSQEPRKKSKTKIVYTRRLVKTKKGYYKPKYVAKKIKVHKKEKKVKGFDPYGLNNIYKIPHY